MSTGRAAVTNGRRVGRHGKLARRHASPDTFTYFEFGWSFGGGGSAAARFSLWLVEAAGVELLLGLTINT